MITGLAVLKAAAEFCASRPELKSAGLLALATLVPLAALLIWSLLDPSTGAATLILSLLVALAVVAING